MGSEVWGSAVAESVLALARSRAEQAEVYVFETDQVPVSFESNRLKGVERRHFQGLALRLVRGGRLGSATAMGPVDPQVLVNRALVVSSYGPEVALSFASQVPEVTSDGLYSVQTAELSVERMIQIGHTVVGQLLDHRPEVLVDVNVRKQVEVVAVFTDKGASCGYRRSALRVSAHVNRVRHMDILDVHEEAASVSPDLGLDALVARLKLKIGWAERIAQPLRGDVPVLLTPKGAAMLLMGPLEHALSGKSVLEGSSPLLDKLGEPAMSRQISLTDVGVVHGVPGSRPVDDEGVPTAERRLIDGGVVRAFYYDLDTASKAGVNSTGNGLRTSPGVVQPGRNLWILGQGEGDLSSLLRQCPRGLIVDQVMGAWASNVIAGEFSGNVHLGYLFEGGEVVGRVKDTMIAGNVFRCLSGAISVGADSQWIGGSLSVPSILLEAVSVAAG